MTNVVPGVPGPRVASKNHADQTYCHGDRVANFELRFVPAAHNRSMRYLLHTSNCGATVLSRLGERKGRPVPAARTIPSTPQTGDASQPEQPERNRHTSDNAVGAPPVPLALVLGHSSLCPEDNAHLPNSQTPVGIGENKVCPMVCPPPGDSMRCPGVTVSGKSET